MIALNLKQNENSHKVQLWFTFTFKWIRSFNVEHRFQSLFNLRLGGNIKSTIRRTAAFMNFMAESSKIAEYNK